jgi:hypothetical protein
MNYFLVIFIDFFHFFEFKFKFEFWGFYRWVPLPYPSGNGGYRGIPRGTQR